MDRVKEEIERCGYEPVKQELPREPSVLSEKWKKEHDLARLERETNEIKIALASTKNSSVDIAQLEYTFAEHRYQAESQRIEQRSDYETQILDLLANRLKRIESYCS